jgi:hypothetical protein
MGDVPTWFGVVAATAAGIAAFWQLSLQRKQLREQQRVLAQRVLLERRDLYSQLLIALREWDNEMRSALENLISGKWTELDTTQVDHKARTVDDISAEVRLLGSFDVAKHTNDAVMERYEFRSRMSMAALSSADLLAELHKLQDTDRSLMKAMRNDLGTSPTDTD